MTSKKAPAQASALRAALEELARKWTIRLPGGGENRNHFFGQEILNMLASTTDADLAGAATATSDNWGNAGVGVPDNFARVRGYFAFDLSQAIKANPTT